MSSQTSLPGRTEPGPAALQRLLERLNPETRHFKRRQTIVRPTGGESTAGLVLSGAVFLADENEAGKKGILDYFERGSLLGICTPPNLPGNVCYLIAQRECTIAFFPLSRLLACCTAGPPETAGLASRLLCGAYENALRHVCMLEQRRLREKLLLYLKCLRAAYGTDHFALPMSFSDLADYLAIDRSALMREMGKLSGEGILQYKQRKISLLTPWETD